MVAHVLGTLALLAVALLLGATWYEAVVMAPNYERDIPNSLELARQFMQRTSPAHYFRVVAPLAQVLTLLTVITGWSRPGHLAFAAAFGLLVIADVITYTFHYPRLAIMFKSTQPLDSARLARAARAWAVGNWIRGALLVLVLLAVLHGLLQ
jgi:predicted exporter